MSFPYTCDATLPFDATLGLVVLQSDETLEQDLRRVLPGHQVATYVSRIPASHDLTADSIAAMKRELPAAARLFPEPTKFDVVAYACTSGTTLIGAQAVDRMLRDSCATRYTTNPLTAAQAAFRALGARRFGLVTPYTADIAEDVKRAFEADGFAVARAVHFGEQSEAAVVRISASSLIAAAREVAKSADAIFLSCTNLRTLDVIAPLEEALNLPVISSNTALFWHMATLSGAAPHLRGPGRLLQSARAGG